jgi:hypothetical protein
MPKPRALTPLQEEIINRGGEPGSSNASSTIRQTVEPIKPKTRTPKTKPAPEPEPDDSDDNSGLHTASVRFAPSQFRKINASRQRYADENGIDISLNRWIVRACMNQIRQETEG